MADRRGRPSPRPLFLRNQPRDSDGGIPGDGRRRQDLVERAIERIAAAVSGAPGCLKIVQIKEKLATIRIYWSAGAGFTDAMRDAVKEAIDLEEARSTCPREACGEPGRLTAQMTRLLRRNDSTRCVDLRQEMDCFAEFFVMLTQVFPSRRVADRILHCFASVIRHPPPLLSSMLLCVASYTCSQALAGAAVRHP